MYHDKQNPPFQAADFAGGAHESLMGTANWGIERIECVWKVFESVPCVTAGWYGSD